MQHLHGVLRSSSNNEKGIGFTALGDLAQSLGTGYGIAGLTSHLAPLAVAMKEVLGKRKKPNQGCTEAIIAAGKIAQHIGACSILIVHHADAGPLNCFTQLRALPVLHDPGNSIISIMRTPVH
jgi:hypothetical protein